MLSYSGAVINIHAAPDWRLNSRTVPLQKSTTVYPGLASSVTMATKLFSCCLFLTARMFDIFPGEKKAQVLMARAREVESNRFLQAILLKTHIVTKVSWPNFIMMARKWHSVDLKWRWIKPLSWIPTSYLNTSYSFTETFTKCGRKIPGSPCLSTPAPVVFASTC